MTTTCKTYDCAAAILRISLGAIMLSHGLIKVITFTIPGTIGYFDSIGLPPTAAYLTLFAELVGGSALIAGLFTRLVALLSLPLMLGTVWVHSGNGQVFSNQGGGWEFPVFLAIATFIVALQGGGTLALERLPLLSKLPFLSKLLPHTVTA